MCGAVVFSLGRYGISSRKGEGSAKVVVESPAGAYHEMRDRGLRGRAVVVMSRRGYFNPKAADEIIPQWMGFPLSVSSLSAQAEELLTDDNFLWVSLEQGAVRKITYILPDDAFARELERALGAGGVRASPDGIEVPHFGSPRKLQSLRSLPFSKEQVVLYADATFFSGSGGAAGDRALEVVRARIKPAIVIVCPLKGDDSVSDEDRGSLMRFLSLVEVEG